MENSTSQGYFDGMKMSGRQKSFIFLLIAGTMFEQIDMVKFSYIAPPLMKLWGLSVKQVSIINGIFAIGAILGALFFGWLGNSKGRRVGMTTALLLGGLGALLTSCAPNYTLLLVFRAIAGFGICGVVTIEGNYLAEMLPAEQRAKWQGILSLACVVGIILAATIAKELISVGLNNWRFVAAIPSLAMIVGLIFWKIVPESPRWLVSKGRYDEANVIYKDLTGKELVDEHLENTEKNATYKETIKLLISKRYIKRTVFVFTAGLILNNAGWMITYMLSTLLTDQGMAVSQALKIQQIYSLALIIPPFYVMLFGDKGGRKIPYAIAMLIGGIAIAGIGLTGTANIPLLIGFVILMASVLTSHLNFLTIYGGELFPTRVRSLVSGLTFLIIRMGTFITQSFVVGALYSMAGFKGYFMSISSVYILMFIFILAIAPRSAKINLEKLNSESFKD